MTIYCELCGDAREIGEDCTDKDCPMIKSRITAFPGVTRTDLPKGAQPCQEVIEFLEGILEKAKRGEIQAIAIAYVRPDDVTGQAYSHNGKLGHTMTAAVCDLFYRICAVRYDTPDADSFNS